jgi:hypothetical protein
MRPARNPGAKRIATPIRRTPFSEEKTQGKLYNPSNVEEILLYYLKVSEISSPITRYRRSPLR